MRRSRTVARIVGTRPRGPFIVSINVPAATGSGPRQAKSLLGLHGPHGEVVYWNEHLPHMTFLRAIERVAPEVLGMLREVASGEAEALLAWARSFNLNVPWILDAARATVPALATSRGLPVWQRPPGVVLLDDGEPVRPRTNPSTAGGRVRSALGSVHRARPAIPEHAAWLVRWQVRGESHDAIARASYSGRRVNPEVVANRRREVREVVKMLAEFLGLPARPRLRAGRRRKGSP